MDVSVRRRALVVEDDPDVALLIETALAGQGFEVTVVCDGARAVEAVRAVDPDLITLDVGLPGLDGVEVCRRIRPLTDAYVIMVTALHEEIDRLIGLETGADDFLSKPVSPRELKVRVNTLFRRPRRIADPRVALAGPAQAAAPLSAAPLSAAGLPDAVPPPALPDAAHPPAEPAPPHPTAEPAPPHPTAEPAPPHEVLRHRDLVVDVDAYRVQRGAEEISLTPTEFSLLVTMMRAPARVWTREALLREVWGAGWEAETHLAEVHVGNLRRKLGDRRGHVRYVETIRGVGYRMLG